MQYPELKLQELSIQEELDKVNPDSQRYVELYQALGETRQDLEALNDDQNNEWWDD